MTFLAGLSTSRETPVFSGEVYSNELFSLDADIFAPKHPFLHFHMKGEWNKSFFKNGMKYFDGFLKEMNEKGYPYVFAAVEEAELRWENFVGMDTLVEQDGWYIVGRSTWVWK